MRPTRRPSRARTAAALVLLLSALLPAAALAQGKISGRVTDAATGEPLAGVNVFLDGTTQGTSTDVDGEYIILNVRPGDYAVVFSYIGFNQQRIEGVRVATGQTTNLDARLSEQVIEGQEIVVQAERPLVQRDLTASKKTVVAEEIEQLPVEGFFGVLATQAGVTQGAGGEFHIRGGRSNEIAFLVDGLSVGNPFNTNGLATTVAADAIEEMTVISGAFNAEYGKAMSGIVNLVTKEGGDRFEGSVSLYGGDVVSRHGDLFGDPGDLDVSVTTLEATVSGPLPFLRSMQPRIFVSGRRDADDGHLWGTRLHLPSDSANFNVDPWYYEIHGRPWQEYTERTVTNEDGTTTTLPALPLPDEKVAMNPSMSYNLLAKITLRPLSGTKLEYSHLRDGSEYTPFVFGYRFNPDGGSTVRDRSYNHALGWTHTLGDRAFYTVRASYAVNRYRDYLYEDPLDPRYVSTGAIVGFPGINFAFGGNDKAHVYEDARSFRIKADMTNQLGLIHETRVGVEFNRHWLSRENFVVLYDGNRYLEPTVPPIDTPAHDRYENQVVDELSAYAQDKLEFEDFIINAGLRLEYFEPNGRYIPDLLDPTGPLADAKTSVFLLPRLGVSFPITERGIIHFSYGHFAQMPSLRSMYINPEFEFPKGSAPAFGNTNLRPERTVQYEMGLQQQIAGDLAFDVTGFYKDIRDYLAQQTVRHSTIAGEDLYSIYLNRDYANVKGVTFSLQKRRPRGGWVGATVDYTYQIAEGNNTDANAFFFNFLSGRENELEVVPLSFDQRHVLSSTVTVGQPGWGASFIAQFATGYPYSPLIFDQNLDLLPNSGRKPAQTKLDAHLFKDFSIGRADVRVFGKVFNVLDRLNERFVFDDTGRATYSLSGERNQHAAWEPFYGLPGIQTLDTYDTRPQYYSAPREVRVGATLSF